jgi:acyl carrier protein
VRATSVRKKKLTRLVFFPSQNQKKTQSADTLEKVRTIISEQLGTDLDAVAADAKFVDLGADSLDTVEIMMALEEQFEITLDEEGAEKIATVQEAADMIQEQMA